jgi:spermidine/putrescine transport system ATP-binding protein
MNTETFLQLKNLRKSFAGNEVIKGIDLNIRQGEFFSILGPSGCGKSTLLRLLAGFETPDEGQVVLAGRDITQDAPEKRPINTVFQSYALFPHMTVYDNVAFGLRMRGCEKTAIAERVQRALCLVEIDGFAQRFSDELSGGQRQRVALARALVNEPKVILLDEPLSALDRQLRIQLQAQLRQLQLRLQQTFIFVTHDQQEALSMSDRVAVVRDGQIEQVGKVEEVYERPKTEFVARFLGASNLIAAERVGNDTFKTSFGVLRIDGHIPVESKVSLSIRRERVALLSTPCERENSFAATISDISYYGSGCEYSITTDDGCVLHADKPAFDRTQKFFEFGQRVWFTLNPTDFVVVSRI